MTYRGEPGQTGHGIYVGERQARLLAALIRSHLGESVWVPKRSEELDGVLRALLEPLDGFDSWGRRRHE